MIHFAFRILLVQSVFNLEHIGQKTLEKTEGAAKSGQFRREYVLFSFVLMLFDLALL
jgi:hypothetical protein